MRRQPVNKQKSAKQFRSNVRQTKAANVTPRPERGGYRL